MKELGLQDLLRYVLAGGIGIASLLRMYPGAAFSVRNLDAAKEVEIVVGASLVLGSVIYNVHRALVYPVFYRIIGLVTLPCTNLTLWLLLPWRPSQDEIEADRWRRELKEEARQHWSEWGAQTHFLYCAAWAILLVLVFGRYVVGGAPDCQARRIFWIIFSVILVAGVVHNFRLLYTLAEEMSRKA